MKIKIIKVVLFLVITLTASCSSTNARYPTTFEGAFRFSTELSCKYRNSGNKKYCECFSGVMSEVTPHAIKVIASDPTKTSEASQEISKIIISNSEKLSQCDRYNAAMSDIPKVEITTFAEQILKKNMDQLLTPELVSSLSVPNIKVGYEFAMHYPGTEVSSKYKLSKVYQGKYYFDYIDSYGKTLKDKYYWENGINYIQVQRDGISQYRLRSGMEKCKYMLGNCSYTTSSGRIQNVYTEFRKGIWFSSYRRYGKPVVDLNIYDINGYPLYKCRYVIENKKYHEQVRVDEF